MTDPFDSTFEAATMFANVTASADEAMSSDVDLNTERSRQAFALVIAAAAATGVGSMAVFFPSLAKYATAPVLAASLGFASGVMLYVSFVDILTKAQDGFVDNGHSEDTAFIYATVTFFGGIILMKVSKKHALPTNIIEVASSI